MLARRRSASVLISAVVLAAAAVWAVRAEPDFLERVRHPLRYEAVIRTHAANYDLEPSLLAAVIYTESRFDPAARSSAGAVGLMQLLPDTAKGIALRTGGARFVV
ncbi:MAG: transglycosylase SLT domain-containing protein, partial [Gaiella sp.]